MLPLDEHITKIRTEFPAVRGVSYLNTGTIAPIPLCVLDAHQARERRYHLGGPLDREYSEHLRQSVAAVRGKLAGLLEVPVDRMALVENTTAGINAALLSQKWGSGDQVLTTDAEHPAVLLPLAYLQRRFGVVVIKLSTLSRPLGADQIGQAMSAQTRAIVISQVSYSTGEAFDVPGICSIAADRGIITVIDGAQSAGAMQLNLASVDPDFFAFPGYKWLLGPQGTAGLYVSSRACNDSCLPYRIGSHAVARRSDDGGFELHASARRFEGTATTAALDIVTLGDAVDFIGLYGLEAVTRRIAELCELFKQGLTDMGPDIELVTPDDRSRSAGLVVFKLNGREAPDVADNLYRQGLIIRTVAGNALRASFHFYNTAAEVERLLAAVRGLISLG